MKLLATFALSLISALPLAQAFLDFGNVTPITDKDIYCESANGGAAIAILLPTGTEKAKVWQTDPGEEEGLELSGLKFKLGPCQKCLEFEGTLVRGLKMHGKLENDTLVYSAKVKDPESLVLSCQWL